MTILFFSSDSNGEQVRQALQKEIPAELAIVDWQNADDASKQKARYAIAWNPPADFFDGLEGLQAIFSVAAGVDHLLNHPGLPEGVPLARLEDAGMAEKIAEYVLYGVLHAQRSFDLYRENQVEQIWDTSLPDLHAGNTRVGILGLGTIGCVVAKRLMANGYVVSGWSRNTKTLEGAEVHAGKSELASFLKDLDVMVCLLPLTASTKGIVNAELIDGLNDGTYLINAARGQHVVTDDLLAALDSGKLRGALLDVTEPEPLPQGHPLWLHPKVLVTPHIAGPTQMHESVQQIAANILRAEQGEALTGLVDRKQGY